MFDFEKLEVYTKAKEFNRLISVLLSKGTVDSNTTNQLSRASLSIVLNIAEGTGRFSKRDKRHFYVISRSSIFECVAILDVLKDEEKIDMSFFSLMHVKAEELSKILFALIRGLER